MMKRIKSRFPSLSGVIARRAKPDEAISSLGLLRRLQLLAMTGEKIFNNLNAQTLVFRLASLFIVFMLFPCFAFAVDSATIVGKANRLYRDKKYDDAITLYNQALIKEPNCAQVHYNIGTALYKKGDYQKAISSFEKALSAPDKRLEAKANYNIANSKYRIGKRKENTDLAQAVELLRGSLDYYKRAIELNAKDKSAKLNHELVEKELKVLLDKLKQQPPQQQQNGKSGQEQDQEQKQEQKDKEQGSQSSQGGDSQQEQPAQQEEPKQQQGQLKQNSQEDKNGQEKSAGKKGEEAKESSLEPTGTNGQQGKEMSEKEAAMILDDYRRQENMQAPQGQETQRPYSDQVDKDW